VIPETLAFESAGRRVVYVLRADLTDPDGSTAWYEPVGGGEPAEATGAVWVRFREGDDASARASDLAAAGYRIENLPGYAPHAAFVRGEDLAASLSGLDALRAIDGVELVEPQLRRKRALR